MGKSGEGWEDFGRTIISWAAERNSAASDSYLAWHKVLTEDVPNLPKGVAEKMVELDEAFDRRQKQAEEEGRQDKFRCPLCASGAARQDKWFAHVLTRKHQLNLRFLAGKRLKEEADDPDFQITHTVLAEPVIKAEPPDEDNPFDTAPVQDPSPASVPRPLERDPRDAPDEIGLDLRPSLEESVGGLEEEKVGTVPASVATPGPPPRAAALKALAAIGSESVMANRVYNPDDHSLLSRTPTLSEVGGVGFSPASLQFGSPPRASLSRSPQPTVAFSLSRSPARASEASVATVPQLVIRQAGFVPTPRPPPRSPPRAARLEVPRDGQGRTSVLPFIAALFLLTWAGLGPN